MKNKICSGRTMTWTNGTGSTVTAGTLVVVDRVLWVAAVDIANGESGTLETGAVFELPKVDAAVIAQGETLTWDVSAGKFDDNLATPATGDITGAAAFAYEAKGVTAGSASVIQVMLTGVPGTKT